MTNGTAVNLGIRRYYFEPTTSPNVIWADLEGFDLIAGAPVMELKLDSIDLSGNVTDKFVQQVTAPF